jgi:hypothetical protein
MTNMCPTCGYPDLYEPAYGSRAGSLEICPSCGFQFGYTDHGKHITHDQWRNQWIDQGMPWSSIGIKQPMNWDPQKQLLNVGVKV